jgi:ribosomal protein L37AE/L43A
MARTNVRPYDYNRPQQPAKYNNTCPICGRGCYASNTTKGMCYTCPKCGHISADAANVLVSARAIVAERELEIFGDNPESMETPYQIRASLGV